MAVELNIEVQGDGQVELKWSAREEAQAWYLLLVRTGAKKAFTSLLLSGEVERYSVSSLSRHQRYQMAVLGVFQDGSACSSWVSVTPRAGLAPLKEVGDAAGIASRVRRVEKLILMPQDKRVTAFWELTPGFADKVVLEVLDAGRSLKRLELEPEVKSCALTADRGLKLVNGHAYQVRLSTRFASLPDHAPQQAAFTPALPGAERAANLAHDQSRLVFASIKPSPELTLFPEEGTESAPAEKGADVLCCHCSHKVQWEGQKLLCQGCHAEFVQNADGEYLDVARLRFGTCRCCTPSKILVQPPGTDLLICSYSGKEHIRLAGTVGFRLIEDLPHGLCQCCRPRQPLIKEGDAIRCGKSRETHRNVDGRYVLVPTEMVFDAKAIDELMDAGLADICQAGVSRAGRR